MHLSIYLGMSSGLDLASAGLNSKCFRGAPKAHADLLPKMAKNPKITKVAITLVLIVRFEKFKSFGKLRISSSQGPYMFYMPGAQFREISGIGLNKALLPRQEKFVRLYRVMSNF